MGRFGPEQTFRRSPLRRCCRPPFSGHHSPMVFGLMTLLSPQPLSKALWERLLRRKLAPAGTLRLPVADDHSLVTGSVRSGCR
jgi:hypothetical protein